MRTAQIIRPAFAPGRRIVAVSDIHGNLPFFRALLERVGLDRDDILILVGDLLEKGPQSLDLLRCVMELSRRREVYTLCGNCDDLVREFVDEDGFLGDRFYQSYLPRHPESAVWQLGEAAGCPRPELTGEGLARLRRAIRQNCRPELDFLRSLPHILETEHLIFVHGGVPSQEHMERLSAWHVMKNDEFMSQSVAFQKYCVVGHWPVTLYDPAIPCARPRIDRRRHIVSIDGGCCLKRDGQLNALVLPGEGSGTFLWAGVDGLPRVTALEGQRPSPDPVNVRWGRNRVEVLERGEELSLCRHLETGRVLRVLTAYLYDSPEGPRCEDSTDYLLPVEPGDRLTLVAETSGGILAKKDGVTGWYRGTYTMDRNERDDAGLSTLD